MTALLTFVVYFLAQFGFAYIVGFAKISELPRYLLAPPTRIMVSGNEAPAPGLVNRIRWWLIQLVECPACLGFWTGAIGGRFLLDGVGVAAPFSTPWLLFIFFGCATAGSNFLLGRLTRLI